MADLVEMLCEWYKNHAVNGVVQENIVHAMCPEDILMHSFTPDKFLKGSVIKIGKNLQLVLKSTSKANAARALNYRETDVFIDTMNMVKRRKINHCEYTIIKMYVQTAKCTYAIFCLPQDLKPITVSIFIN